MTEPTIKESLISQISEVDPENLKKIFQVLSMMIRAFEGKNLDEKDAISRLINLQSKMERSRFPSMAIINFQVYCRLLSNYYPEECEAYGKWADLQAEALIPYKGLNWDAYVDMVKAQYGNPQAPQGLTSINLNPQQRALQEQTKKKHWWNRKKSEETEFKKD